MRNYDLGLLLGYCDVILETDIIDLSIDNIDGRNKIP
jgi:hypothetical protein